MEDRTDSTTDRVVIPSHINELSRSLYQLQQDNNLCDVLLVGKDGTIAAHSIILSAVSSYFRQFIVNSEKKEESVSVYLNGELMTDIQNLITFIYTGYISVTSENVHRIVKLLKIVNLNNAVEYLTDHVIPIHLQRQSHASFDSPDKVNGISKQSEISFEMNNVKVDRNEQKCVENADGVMSLNNTVTCDLSSDVNTSQRQISTCSVKCIENPQEITDICQFNLDPTNVQAVSSKKQNIIENITDIDYGIRPCINDYESSSQNCNEDNTCTVSNIVKEERIDLGFTIISDRDTNDTLQQNKITTEFHLDQEKIDQEPLNLSHNLPHNKVEFDECVKPKRGRKRCSENNKKCKDLEKIESLKKPEQSKQQQRMLRSNQKNVSIELTCEKLKDKSINIRRKPTENINKKLKKNNMKINLKNDKSENSNKDLTQKSKQIERVKSRKNKISDRVKKKQSKKEIETKKNENIDDLEIHIPVVKEEREISPEILGVKKENTSRKRTRNSDSGNSDVPRKKKMAKNPRTRCVLCNLNFENPEDYLTHRNEKHKTLHPGWNKEKKLYVCNYDGCDYQIRNRGFVARHKDLVHGDPIDENEFNIFRCEIEGCNYYHVQKSRIKAHLKDHSAEISVICDICGKGYKHKKGLLLHKKSHIPAEERNYKYPCTICGKRFYLKGSLSQHMKRHTDKNTILCHLCPYNNNCDSIKQLDIHLFKVHQVPLPDHIPIYRCSQCDYYTFYKNVFNSHLSKHAGEKFDCDICGKSFGSKLNLLSHKNRHKITKVKCPYDRCNYYGFKIDMRDHLLSMHKFKNSKPFACHLCEYRCNLQGNLTKHLRGKHKLEVQTTSTLWRKLMETGQGYDTIFKQSRTFAIEKVERTPLTKNEKKKHPGRPEQEQLCLGAVVPPVSESSELNQEQQQSCLEGVVPPVSESLVLIQEQQQSHLGGVVPLSLNH